MQARFHRAEWRAGDAGDVLDGEGLEKMQQENGALRRRQLIQQFHEGGFLFLPDEQGGRVVLEFGRSGGDFLERLLFAMAFAPALNAFLMSDAEEPASKPFVVAQAADVPRGANEGFLDDIEARLFIVNQLDDIGVKR